MTADPARRLSSVDVLDADEHARLDEIGQPGGVDPAATAPVSIPGLFAAQVARTPEAVALTFEGRSMTYRELDEASNRLAHLLAGQGAGPGTVCGAAVFPVGRGDRGDCWRCSRPGRPICRSTRRVPAARIGFMLDDAAPIAAITTTGLADRLDGHDLLVIDVNDPRIDT